MNSIKSIRKDWDLIESLISAKSRILDVGCGEGDLIQQFKENLKANVHGIEKSQDLAIKGIARGLNITHGDAEKDLFQYANQSFDYVILSQTLQAMMDPKKILIELLRVGSKAIVSFPNFGHWKIRLQLLLWGKMPITEGLPYSWYDTPNIHFFTLKDFENLCNEMNIVIEKSIGLTNKGKQFSINNSILPANIITHEAIFLLSYKNFEPIKIKSKNKTDTLDLNVPKITYFIHKIYIQCARNFWRQPWLFHTGYNSLDLQRNLIKSEKLIKESILETIRKLLPLKEVLQQYLNHIL